MTFKNTFFSDKFNNPWGRPPSGNGGGDKEPNRFGGGGNNPPPPDFDKLFREGQKRLKKAFSGGGNSNDNPHPGGKKFFIFAFIILIALWLVSGFYVVEADEEAAVLRFGKYVRTSDPGLNYRLPAPIETEIKLKVTTINREELGFRSSVGGIKAQQAKNVTEESLMLTGDENIVDINFEVQWRIKSLKDFLFNSRNPEETVKNAAESAMREVIGRTPIAKSLAEGRLDIEQESQKVLQEMLDIYGTGVEIVRLQMLKVDPPAKVIDAFRDVQTARADKEREINQAETYRNDILPRARGEAEKILQEAKAYEQQIVAKSEGDASRFLAVYEKYVVSKDVTKKRIYLETMENILKNTNKIIVGDKGVNSLTPFLPLNEIKKSTEKSQ